MDQQGLSVLVFEDPTLLTFINRSGAVDFASAAAARAVTRALLAEHYGVAWDVEERQLIPPVPGRANYIAWLADLLALSSPPGEF